jgi:hypothetical protein
MTSIAATVGRVRFITAGRAFADLIAGTGISLQYTFQLDGERTPLPDKGGLIGWPAAAEPAVDRVASSSEP